MTTIPTLTAPALIDLAVSEYNTDLLTNLSWLNNAFGKAKKITEKREKGNYVYPTVYTGSNQYMSLFPDEKNGNYCFWDTKDGHKIDPVPNQGEIHTTDIGLIFWFRYDAIYTDHELRSLDNVKSDVLAALRAATTTKSHFTPISISEEANNIFPVYSYPEIENQYLMRPYGGFRIDGELKYHDC